MAEKNGIAKKISLLMLFISAGLLAYGMGLYQGNKYRTSRSIASDSQSLPVPLSNPGNTQSPMSHSE